MPNIPVFNAPEPDIRVSDLASEAWTRAAREIGESGREAAQSTAAGIKAVGVGLDEAGQKLQQNQEANEHLQGIQSLTNIESNFQQQRQTILGGDPDQVESGLMKLRQDEASQISAWQNTFTNPKMKLWAAEQARDFTLRQNDKLTVDLNEAAANTAMNTGVKTVNNIVTGLGSAPSTGDIDRALAQYDQLRDATLKNPNITSPETRQRITDAFEKDKSQIIINALSRNPNLAGTVLQKYGTYLSPEQQTALQTKVNSDAARSVADQMISSWTGGAQPGHPPIDSTDGMTNATRAASVLRNEFHWSDAAIAGALNSVKSESEGREWNNPGAAGEMGMYQFMPGGHLDAFQSAYPGDHSVEAQTRYMAQWVNKNIPGYGTSQDPQQATYAFVSGFERPKAPKDPATGELDYHPVADTRFQNNAWSQAAIQGLNSKPAPTIPSPQPAAAATGTVAVGDSIAWGLIKHGGLAGSGPNTATGHQTFGATDTAAIGNNPTEILNQIKALPDAQFQGKNVVLSTGWSNAAGADNTQLVQQQIDALKQKGAANITVLGVGPKIGDAANQQLAQIAQKNGAQFSGPLSTGPDGVHPVKWQDFAHSLPQPAGNEGGGDSGTPASAQPTNTSQAPFPSLEDAMKQVYARTDLNATQKQEIIDRLRSAHAELTSMAAEERANLMTDLQGGLEKLKQGLPYQFDEGQVRHYFEPKTADKMIGQLKEAQQIGAQIGDIRNEPVNAVISNSNILQNSLKDTSAGDFQERAQMVQAYLKAAQDHLKELGVLPSEKQADPVTYLTKINPDLANAHDAVDLSNPASAQTYVTKMLAYEDHLGLTSQQQHVLSIPQAQAMTQQILQNPNHALDLMNQWQNAYGPGWDHVWADMTTLGKLPAAYQLMGALEPHDAAMLARALTEQTTAKLGDKGTEGYWSDTLGKSPGGQSNYETIKNTIRGDPTVQSFVLSMRNSNASGEQIKSLLGAIDTLAFARTQYVAEDADAAATNAIHAALDHYSFALPGAPRVPRNVADAVTANANQTLDQLSPDTIQVPQGIGGNGQATAEQYINFIKAKPVWFTTPKEDAVELVDPAGRLVRDKSGNPISVQFNAPAPVATIPPAQQPTEAGVPYGGVPQQ